MSSIAEQLTVERAAAARPIDGTMALAGFAAAVALAIAGAFVGLDAYGFWFDELFTRRVVDPDAGLAGLFARIATDVHPPVYPTTLFLWAKLVGDSDAALRLFSALAASASLLVFVAAKDSGLSLRGRLFGAAVAGSSGFWFFQSQNARSYGLCLLISAAILVLSLRLLRTHRERSGGGTLAALLALMLVGSFTHFYMLYESLAVLAVLVVLRPRDRIASIAAGAALAIAAVLYMKLVMAPYSQASLDNNWYPNTPHWYLRVLASSWQDTFGGLGRFVLAIVIAVALANRLPLRALIAAMTRRRPAPATLLLAGVPLLVLMAAIVSSTLLSPNFFDRNYLVLSPFFWAIAATLYDSATAEAPSRVRAAVNVALALMVVTVAAITVLQRPQAGRPAKLYEPFRESAEWIAGQPACRGSIVPVITPDRRAWYRPGFADALYGSIYGHYLAGFATPKLIFLEDLRAGRLDPAVANELRARLAGAGCPVLAWAVHNVDAATFQEATADLLRAVDAPAGVFSTKLTRFEQGEPGYALSLER